MYQYHTTRFGKNDKDIKMSVRSFCTLTVVKNSTDTFYKCELVGTYGVF